MKFVSRPKVVEAEQFTGSHPAVFGDAEGGFTTVTSTGPARVNLGDWLIKEPYGDGWYPCAAAHFAAYYQPYVEGGPSPTSVPLVVPMPEPVTEPGND